MALGILLRAVPVGRTLIKRHGSLVPEIHDDTPSFQVAAADQKRRLAWHDVDTDFLRLAEYESVE